ncbi:thioredoxin family protein [uncultured Nevskia sp.]|uniref:thioredoxin family protein n=1 Tax=uncultured Nevskia sp. TaxID=228950 RepID=UPI0025E3CB6C|nr:thioredoxin family protein [uncultured Nevskia sp.]
MNRKWLRYGAYALVPVALYFVNVEVQTRRGIAAMAATELEFRPLAAALVQAKAEGKPVLADFSAIWCPTCRRLHTEVFSDPAVKAAINAGYVLSGIDYESAEAPAFMARYEVSSFPSLLVLDGDGALLRKLPITFDPLAFAAALKP